MHIARLLGSLILAATLGGCWSGIYEIRRLNMSLAATR